jgi:hypothetical protein
MTASVGFANTSTVKSTNGMRAFVDWVLYTHVADCVAAAIGLSLSAPSAGRRPFWGKLQADS